MSKTAAERQRESRQRKRDEMSQKNENVTCHDVTPPQEPPQSTNGGEVEAEHPAVPGDAGYEGCCKLVDGEWQVDNTKPPIKGMSTDELVRRLHFIEDWQRSPEHREVLSRRVGA